jgi:hypothetical protein
MLQSCLKLNREDYNNGLKMMVVNFKICECNLDSWEVIVVDDDGHFEGKSTIYYHCDECGKDFAVLDYHTEEILYLNSSYFKKEIMQR